MTKLLIDIGNSTIVAAIAEDNGAIEHTWRFKTMKEETTGFFRKELQAGIDKHRIDASLIGNCIISSVVPEVNDDIQQAVIDVTGVTPRFFTVADAAKLIDICIESPSQLGKDRIADAIGAMENHGVPCIVIDMGTATTVGVVNEKRQFLGGMIIPGVKTSLKALCSRASQLPTIDIEKPRSIIGVNTLECMQSGIIYGTAAMIDGIIDRIQTEHGKEMRVVATGGMAQYIVPFCNHSIILDNHLQFKGLAAID